MHRINPSGPTGSSAQVVAQMLDAWTAELRIIELALSKERAVSDLTPQDVFVNVGGGEVVFVAIAGRRFHSFRLKDDDAPEEE